MDEQLLRDIAYSLWGTMYEEEDFAYLSEYVTAAYPLIVKRLLT